MKIIDESLLSRVGKEAQESPRLRKNYNFHQSLDDRCHRFLNALLPGTVIPIHHHPTKDESFILLKGKVRVLTYDDDGNVVVGAHAGKGAGRVTGTLDHQDAFVLLGQAGAHGEGFRLLEGAGFHLGANLGPVTREGDIEVLQAQELGQALALIGNGRVGALEGPADGEPLGVAVQAFQVLPGLEQARLIDGTHQGRGRGLRIGQGPAFVGKHAACQDIRQLILGRFEFHIDNDFTNAGSDR